MGTATSNDLTYAAIGGAMVGGAASAGLLFKGRMLSVSNITTGVFADKTKSFWRASFVLAMMMTACLFNLNDKWAYFIHPAINALFLNGIALIISGFLIGFGSGIAGGDISFHGLCGLPIGSVRSILSTFLMAGFAMGMATLRNNVSFLDHTDWWTDALRFDHELSATIFAGTCGALILCILIITACSRDRDSASDIILSTALGAIFAAGLIVAGVVSRMKVLSFLTISHNWNGSWLLFAGVAALITCLVFNLAIRQSFRPWMARRIEIVEEVTPMTWQAAVGSIMFGLGWGFLGISPATMITQIPFYFPHIMVVFFPAALIGMLVGNAIHTRFPDHHVKHEHHESTTIHAILLRD